MTFQEPRTPRAEDIPAILDLFQAAFHRSFSARHYAWKLATRPTPADRATVVFGDDGRAAFHLGGVPCRARIQGAERWVMIAVDGMTSPASRRQGLLSTHLPRLFGYWKDAGVSLVLGLPNQQWGSRTRALGWRPLSPLSWLVLPLAPERLVARRVGVPAIGRLSFVSSAWRRRWAGRVPADLAIADARSAPADLDDLWQQAGGALPFSIARDRAWVSWRYLESPDVRYELLIARRADRVCGYAAYRVHDWGVSRSAVIAEVWTAPDDRDAFDALGRTVLDRLASNGVDVVRTLAVPGSIPFERWRALGFFRSRHSFDVEHVRLDESIDSAALENPAGCWMMAGDFDVV